MYFIIQNPNLWDLAAEMINVEAGINIIKRVAEEDNTSSFVLGDKSFHNNMYFTADPSKGVGESDVFGDKLDAIASQQCVSKLHLSVDAEVAEDNLDPQMILTATQVKCIETTNVIESTSSNQNINEIPCTTINFTSSTLNLFIPATINADDFIAKIGRIINTLCKELGKLGATLNIIDDQKANGVCFNIKQVKYSEMATLCCPARIDLKVHPFRIISRENLQDSTSCSSFRKYWCVDNLFDEPLISKNKIAVIFDPDLLFIKSGRFMDIEDIKPVSSTKIFEINGYAEIGRTLIPRANYNIISSIISSIKKFTALDCFMCLGVITNDHYEVDTVSICATCAHGTKNNYINEFAVVRRIIKDDCLVELRKELLGARFESRDICSQTCAIIVTENMVLYPASRYLKASDSQHPDKKMAMFIIKN